VLVLHDMLGLNSGPVPRFVRNFLAEGGSVADALARYAAAVRDGSFPDPQTHGY
jgi:3-methyl-2-oxobutanoate hydroxymethyltransferase